MKDTSARMNMIKESNGIIESSQPLHSSVLFRFCLYCICGSNVLISHLQRRQTLYAICNLRGLLPECNFVCEVSRPHPVEGLHGAALEHCRQRVRPVLFLQRFVFL